MTEFIDKYRSVWFAPLKEFLAYEWELAKKGTDYRQDLTNEEITRRLENALNILKACDNQGHSRQGQFNHGGEPERSRLEVCMAFRLLSARGLRDSVRELVRLKTSVLLP